MPHIYNYKNTHIWQRDPSNWKLASILFHRSKPSPTEQSQLRRQTIDLFVNFGIIINSVRHRNVSFCSSRFRCEKRAPGRLRLHKSHSRKLLERNFVVFFPPLRKPSKLNYCLSELKRTPVYVCLLQIKCFKFLAWNTFRERENMFSTKKSVTSQEWFVSNRKGGI